MLTFKFLDHKNSFAQGKYSAKFTHLLIFISSETMCK